MAHGILASAAPSSPSAVVTVTIAFAVMTPASSSQNGSKSTAWHSGKSILLDAATPQENHHTALLLPGMPEAQSPWNGWVGAESKKESFSFLRVLWVVIALSSKACATINCCKGP